VGRIAFLLTRLVFLKLLFVIGYLGLVNGEFEGTIRAIHVNNFDRKFSTKNEGGWSSLLSFALGIFWF
jgi:hypothetical protein